MKFKHLSNKELFSKGLLVPQNKQANSIVLPDVATRSVILLMAIECSAAIKIEIDYYACCQLTKPRWTNINSIRRNTRMGCWIQTEIPFDKAT